VIPNFKEITGQLQEYLIKASILFFVFPTNSYVAFLWRNFWVDELLHFVQGTQIVGGQFWMCNFCVQFLCAIFVYNFCSVCVDLAQWMKWGFKNIVVMVCKAMIIVKHFKTHLSTFYPKPQGCGRMWPPMTKIVTKILWL